MGVSAAGPIYTDVDSDRVDCSVCGDRCDAPFGCLKRGDPPFVVCPWGSGFVAVRPGARYGRFDGGPLLPRHPLTRVGKQHHVVRVPGGVRPAWITKRLRKTVVQAASVLGWDRVRDVDPDCAYLIERFAWTGEGAVDDLTWAVEVAEFNADRLAPDDAERELYERFAEGDPR